MISSLVLNRITLLHVCDVMAGSIAPLTPHSIVDFLTPRNLAAVERGGMAAVADLWWGCAEMVRMAFEQLGRCRAAVPRMHFDDALGEIAVERLRRATQTYSRKKVYTIVCKARVD